MKTAQLKRQIDKLWGFHKKDLDRILKEAQHLTRQGERYIRDQSEKGRAQLEIMALSLQKEKLYYELGRLMARLPKNKWTRNKKALNIASKIRGITRKIAIKKRKQ